MDPNHHADPTTESETEPICKINLVTLTNAETGEKSLFACAEIGDTLMIGVEPVDPRETDLRDGEAVLASFFVDGALVLRAGRERPMVVEPTVATHGVLIPTAIEAIDEIFGEGAFGEIAEALARIACGSWDEWAQAAGAPPEGMIATPVEASGEA